MIDLAPPMVSMTLSAVFHPTVVDGDVVVYKPTVRIVANGSKPQLYIYNREYAAENISSAIQFATRDLEILLDRIIVSLERFNYKKEIPSAPKPNLR